MKIAICDDDFDFNQNLKNKIVEVCKKYAIEHEVTTFISPEDMCTNDIENLYDILFLDIDMPVMNGFDVAKKIKKDNDNIYIIFVSNRDELVFQSLKYHPYFFIRKSHLDEELENQITEINNLIFNTKKNIIFIESNNKTSYIDVADIFYIESNKNYINIYLESEILTTRKSMNKIERELSGFGFLRVHSGFIVNIKYIERFDNKQIELTNKSIIPISRQKSSFVKNKIMEVILCG